MVRAAALVALAACLAVVPAVASPGHDRWLVTLDGVRGVRPGLSEAEVERRLGVTLHPERFGSCTIAFFGSGTDRSHAILWRGRLGSLWFEGDARTDRGIRIGSSFRQLRRTYPRSTIRKDYYVPAARNVFVRRTRAPHWRLRFDVSPEGRVTRIAFGNWTVFLVEGCA